MLQNAESYTSSMYNKTCMLANIARSVKLTSQENIAPAEFVRKLNILVN
jgi:hypothetical protein